jgi:hypothetical protein
LFDDSSFWQHDEAFALIGSLDDFNLDLGQRLAHAGLELLALVAAIGVELEQKGKESEQPGHQHHAAVTVLYIGGVDDRLHQKTLCVDDDMPFLSLDLLAGVISRRVDRGPPFSALFTLWLSMIAAVGLASWPACSRQRT